MLKKIMKKILQHQSYHKHYSSSHYKKKHFGHHSKYGHQYYKKKHKSSGFFHSSYSS